MNALWDTSVCMRSRSHRVCKFMQLIYYGLHIVSIYFEEKKKRRHNNIAMWTEFHYLSAILYAMQWALYVFYKRMGKW